MIKTKPFVQTVQTVPGKGFRDVVEVFVVNNLAAMITPNALISLPPGVRSGLVSDINWLSGGYGFPDDVQEILNAFILLNIDQVSVSPRLVPTPARGI